MTLDNLIAIQITLHQQSKTLEVEFNSGERFIFSCEYLRVFSPSAEVRGHGVGNQKWLVGKEKVNIIKIEAVGNYAIKPVFDDGHSSGIYSWKTLHELGVNQAQNWQLYKEENKMDKEQLKKAVAEAALQFIEPGMVLGVGSGSTIHYFIDALKSVKGKIEAAVASSVVTEKKLRELSIPVVDLNSAGEIPLYIDGADEINSYKQMIKGGGGALTREKIIAATSKKFVCIVDQSKEVDLLGQFPIAVEVIPMARSYVARQIVKLGGDPEYRVGFVTDNGNIILDVHNLKVLNPVELEEKLNNITGVVMNGIFAKRTADTVIVGTNTGVVIR